MADVACSQIVVQSVYTLTAALTMVESQNGTYFKKMSPSFNFDQGMYKICTLKHEFSIN